MKYTVEERLDIGRRVHEGELSRYAAAQEYQISKYTVRDYLGMYRAKNSLSSKRIARNISYKAPVSSAPVRICRQCDQKNRKMCAGWLLSRGKPHFVI
jgi:CENP-B N-terminal DNA-binding domain